MGHLDLDRVVAAGNSCGGITSIALAGSDPRVAAVFVLSGSGSFPGAPPEQVEEAVGDLSVPVAYVVGGPEDIARANAGLDYDAFPEGLPAYIASRAEGDHPTVSITEAILVDEVAGIGINWFDLALFGSQPAMDALLRGPRAPRVPPAPGRPRPRTSSRSSRGELSGHLGARSVVGRELTCGQERLSAVFVVPWRIG